MHIAANFFFKKLKHFKDIKLDIARENNNKDQIFAELEAYELCFIKAIEEEENKAFTNPELKKRSGILKEMKKRV